MKIPTFRQVQKKAEQGKELNTIEWFIIDHYPRNNKEIKKFMRDLQKVVDVINFENTCDRESR